MPPTDRKPTGAQLYREFMKGYSMLRLADYQYDKVALVDHAIRAHLIACDKRRAKCPKK